MHSFCGFAVEQEIGRLEKSEVPENCRKAIKDFLNDIRVKDNHSGNRIYYYAASLRKVAEIIPDSFLNPNGQDIKGGVSDIAGRKHQSGVKYSENTIEDYKIAVKRFFRWLLANDGHNPDVVKWIKKRKATNRNVKPCNMITEKEIA
ncbi:MAG: hypothetical protein M1597_03560 [Candidatus Thermoplasmatota archaeon]|nr:hypothetical protein [Candidatus Thermoplasmatota archaeon]